MERNTKTSQSPNWFSNILNRFKNEKNISSKTSPLKENEKKLTKTKNFTIKTRNANGTKKFNLDDNFTEKMSNLNLKDANLKKSTLQKCNNELPFDKKDFGNSKNAFCFEKNIKVEESEDKSDVAPNNLRTILCDTEVKIENIGTLKIEEINELGKKSELTPATSTENKFNNLSFQKTPSKDSKQDYKSVSNNDDNQNTSDNEIVERAPDKPHIIIGTHRINPLQRKDFQRKISVYNTIAEADEKIDSLIEHFRRQESFNKLSEEIESRIIIMKSKSLSFGVKSNVLLSQNKRAEAQCNNFEDILNPCTNVSYLSNCPDKDFIAADEELEKRKAATPSSECGSPSFQLNDLSGENESVEDFFYGIQNYINHFYQCDNLAPNLLPNPMDYSKFNQTAVEKFWCPSKNGSLYTIASKDQQTCNYELKTQARNRLFNSRAFSKDKCCAKYLEMYSKIRAGEFGTIKKEVIHNLKRAGVKKYRRTNLHAAVMDGNLEETFCIVEMHKHFHKEITFHINIRDKKGMTVLDRAKENQSSIANDLNDLLIKYLEENNAQHSIHHMIPINRPGT